MLKMQIPELSIKNHDIDELGILKGAVENTNEAFVTIDQNHTVIFFNRAAEVIFGYGRNEVIGRDLNIILGPRCSENHRLAVTRYLETKNPRLIGHVSEFVATRRSGETFPAAISFSVSEIGGKLFFTGIVRDLTQTRALQEQVMKSERLATLGQVVAEISHEIKNPLVTIGGFARQLVKTAQDDKTRLKLNTIADEVQRLENLLGDLRNLYRPAELAMERFDINELLQEIYALTKEDADGSDIRLRLNTRKAPIFVEGDRDRLEQVFLNLVKNGIEAMKKGGDLILQSRLSGDTAQITISDEGHGIPKSIRKRVFTPFFTTKKKGTGLGLSITKRILEDHPGCSFTLVSQEGKGTTVKVALGVCDSP
jgi:PAS domain S-box-containing protein